MTDCNYCEASLPNNGKLTDHLAEAHDAEELSRIDRRRVRSHTDESGPGSLVGRITPDGRLSRRAALVAAGTAVTGIGVGIGRRMAQSTTQITDWNDLDNVRNNLNSDYVLANDLDGNTAGYSTVAGPSANGGSGFDPIDGFGGTLDGQENEIAGLVIDRTGTNGVGLFGNTSGGTITRLAIVDADIAGRSSVGGCVGSNSSTIEDVSVSGSVAGVGKEIGGLAGNNGGTVRRSHATATVEETGRFGEENGEVGGLVGINNGTVDKSFAAGNVSGSAEVGGLVGDNDATVRRTYALGTLDSSGGGLVGLNNFNNELSRSYAAAVLTSGGGGLLDRNGTSSSTGPALYWDVDESGTNTSAAGTDLNTSQMIGNEPPKNGNMDGLDYSTPVWRTVEEGNRFPDGAIARADGYPILAAIDAAPQLSAQGIRTRPSVVVEGDDATFSNTTIQSDG